MERGLWLLLPILFPIVSGILLFICKSLWKEKMRNFYVGAVLVANAALVYGILLQENLELTIFYLAGKLPIYLKLDSLGMLFAGFVATTWVLVGFYAFHYMKKGKYVEQFFGFYLITFGVLLGLDFAGNIVTMYLFYEMITVMTVPLILHERTKEAISAGLKYLFYSFFGASLGLLGICFFSAYATTLTFTPGGVLDMAKVAENENLLLAIVFLMLLGFGTKAGMFPLQGWLPTAHPVAPAPASAVFSGVIAKSGILALLRVVYYFIGANWIKGSWVQYSWLTLALISVFIGSVLAYKEENLKKRFAYSTVSQISYIIFGLALCNTTAFEGALLHVIFHGCIKITLFLVAGAIIFQTGATKVSELRGIGKQMPITLWCYTLVSIGLIGIPPTGGFLSKWYLALGSLQSDIPIFAWLGVVILLISALLTAGYLLPITVNGFFPGADYNYQKLEKKEPSRYMIVPMIFLTGIVVVGGMFPTELMGFVEMIAAAF